MYYFLQLSWPICKRSRKVDVVRVHWPHGCSWLAHLRRLEELPDAAARAPSQVVELLGRETPSNPVRVLWLCRSTSPQGSCALGGGPACAGCPVGGWSRPRVPSRTQQVPAPPSRAAVLWGANPVGPLGQASIAPRSPSSRPDRCPTTGIATHEGHPSPLHLHLSPEGPRKQG